jgi:amino acid transporter
MSGIETTVKLRRTLGFWQSLGAAVGLVVAGSTMVSLGNGFGLGGQAFILAALISMIMYAFVIFSFAELANMLPGAGMIGDYTAPALGRLLAIVSVLGGYLVLVSMAGGAEAIIAGATIQGVWEWMPPKAWAIGLTAIFCIVNLLGVKFFGRVQLAMTLVMMSTLAILGILGLVNAFGSARVDSVDFNPGGWGQLPSLLAIGLWLYVGIEYVCPLSEEIKNPGKNIPRAMLWGIVIVFVCDCLFGLAGLNFFHADKLAGSAIPHLVMAEGIAGKGGLYVITLATVFASASSLDSHMAGVPRMLYGLAREGMLPRFFAWLHPRFRTPWSAILLCAAIIMLPLIMPIEIGTIITVLLVACVCRTPRNSPGRAPVNSPPVLVRPSSIAWRLPSQARGSVRVAAGAGSFCPPSVRGRTS